VLSRGTKKWYKVCAPVNPKQANVASNSITKTNVNKSTGTTVIAMNKNAAIYITQSMHTISE
jgi:K+/H+ antiporter YhaU regulatory subunit KhtT